MEKINNLINKTDSKIEQSSISQDDNVWLNFLPVFSVLLGLLMSGLMMLFLGYNPLTVYSNTVSYTHLTLPTILLV